MTSPIVPIGKRDIQALVVRCPNDGCDETMERCDARDHVTKCPHTLISCKYEHIGCTTELKRKDKAAHEQDDKFHLHIALETVDALKEESQTMKNKGSVTVAVTDFQKKKSADSTYASPPFYTHPHGYHMALLVYANGFHAGRGTHVSAAIILLKGRYDAGLKWPITGQLTITMLNQLENKNHRSDVLNITEKDSVRLGSCWGNRQFTPHSALTYNPAKNIQYLKDDTLYFRVSMEVADRKPWLDCLVK